MACPNRGDGPKSCRNVQFLPSHVQVDPRTLAAGADAAPLAPPNSATLSPLKASEANTHGTVPKSLTCVHIEPFHSQVSPNVLTSKWSKPPKSTDRSRVLSYAITCPRR